MKTKFLDKPSALQPGADLWILPQIGQSEWSRILDWPLNLQITKAGRHASPEIPEELKHIAREHDMHIDFKPVKGPLLIACEGLLPTRMVAILDGAKLESWFTAGRKLWQDLRQPTVRLFLPHGTTWDSVKDSLPAWAELEAVEVVESNA